MALVTTYHHLYDKAQWKRLRKQQLEREPLCKYCQGAGLIVQAGVVDHIKPHKGDERLFFDSDNLQSMCKTCHDKAKAIEESRGYVIGCDLDGIPLDANERWRA
jgi:5-methylcytosine-specific restriction protein A